MKRTIDLSDGSAASVIRALLDFRSVWTTHDLVALSQVTAPTIHRVVAALEAEELVTRTAGAVVAVPDWFALLRRWTKDYRFNRNSLTRWRPTGTLDALLTRIPTTQVPYAVTGAAAARHWAPDTQPAALTIYTPDASAAAEAWQLNPASRSGAVVLAEPSAEVVYTRPRKTSTGLRLAAPAQTLTDLLTGAAPATAAAALSTWMQAHELDWRY